MLLIASYLFYGAWDARFLLLIAISTVVDFLVAQRITVAPNRTLARRWGALSIMVTLGILVVFKYFDFFSASFSRFLAEALARELPAGTTLSP